ncbi:MAG TPA: Na+/H+ antiporter [Nitrospiria bacterium]|jgi:CPA1 family monovalent cation:H+ antiporter|nr:Na+/H+ antiporter [Nitrospiria bacterium]
MEVTNLIEIVLVLIAAMVGLTILSNRLSVPVPLILVPAGVLLGFIPWFPQIELNPDLILLVFLPPLVYAGGFSSSWQAFRKNLRPIFLLSFGLVLFTMGVVAVVAHRFIPGLGWAAAFVLGAIVAPTDDVAAATIARRLSLPHRIVSVLEGEGLMNDATALTAFRFATAAAVIASFSFNKALGTFLAVVFGEVGYGLFLGWAVSKFRQKLGDPALGITVSLLTPYLAYLPAERLGGSGVLATAVAGLYIGRNFSLLSTPGIRLAAIPIWQMLVFILNNVLFLVTGLQLKSVIENTAGLPASALLYDGVLISVAVIAARILWVFPSAFLPRFLSARIRKRDPLPPWRQIFIVSWTGMRGSVSLAAAFGIPALTQIGTPFPDRHLIIFITFCVIVSTLVFQGITLPSLIRWLGVDRDGARERRGAHYQETSARIEAAHAALAEIDTWPTKGDCSIDTARHLRGYYQKQIHNLNRHRDEESDGEFGHLSKREVELQLKALATERSKIMELHNAGRISDAVLRFIELDLDLQEMRLDQTLHPNDTA